MARRVKYHAPGGSYVEITDRIPREGWELAESAEEGATPGSTLPVEDSTMDFDVLGHSTVVVYEDESTDNDVCLFGGFVAEQAIARSGGDLDDPIGRNWVLSLTDGNTWWQRRILTGSDCKRPAETDVQRMQWLFTTSEMTATIEDTTTYLDTSGPVNMDKADYRGQFVSQVVDDCAQATGKNWWIKLIYVPAIPDFQWTAWYGPGDLTTYSSDLALSNDPVDLDEAAMLAGTATVWPISGDTVLKRDPSRVFSGVYLEGEFGAVYRQSATTAAAFARRDTTMPSPNVKTKTKAIARVDRYLLDLDEQAERTTTTVELPKALATKIRAGMRILFKATHLPGYETFVWCRILTCSVAPVAAGSRYRLTLELDGPGTAPGALETVTLHGCNSVLETSSRNITDSATGSTFAVGQVWRYTLSQPAHGADAYTSDFAIAWNTTVPLTASTVVRGWGVSVLYPGVVGTPTPQPNQGAYPAYTALSETGTFVITSAGTGRFEFYANANYPGAASIDECWTILLERIS